MYAAGNMASTRAPDLLSQIQKEFESVAHTTQMYKAERDDIERKLEHQLTELNNLQMALSDLERNHLGMKKTYEEEILRLRRQIESAGGTVQSGLSGALGAALAPQIDTLPQAVGLPGFANIGGAAPNNGQHPAGLPEGLGGPNGPGGMGMGMLAMQAAQGGAMIGAAAAAAAQAPPTQVQPKVEPAPGPVAQAPPQPPAAATARPAQGAGESMKAVDSKGRPMEDWNVVHNPNASTKMHLELSHTLEHDSVVCCVRFSSDGRFIATGCNKTAVLYDAHTGARLCMFSNEGVLETQVALDNLTCGDSYVRSVCFSPDSKLLVAGAEDKTIKVWDILGKRLRHTLHGHTKDIYSVDFSADGSFVVSGSGDKRAKLWDVNTGECVRTFGDEEGPKDGVTSVAVSPDGRFIAAGSLDRVVRLWDVASGLLVEKYDGHQDSVYSVSFSPDGGLLASGSLDKTIKLWDLGTAGHPAATKCRHTFQGHKDFVLSVVFAPQGPWLISGSKDRSVQFWDPRHVGSGPVGGGEEGPVLILQGHQNSVISVAHSPAARLFATGSGDKRARIWRYHLLDR